MALVDVWRDGELIQVDVAELELETLIVPAIPAITFKSDIFDRCRDDAEAQTILNGVAAMGAKLSAFFDAVRDIRHDHPLFAELKAGFVTAFGEARAGELLAPSI